jgi:hypothetical protein
VVLDAANDDGLAIKIREDAAHVSVQFLARGFVTEEWPSVFCGKDCAHENF